MKLEDRFRELYCDRFGYVAKNNLCLFQKGPLSQWWGGFKDQNSTLKVESIDLYRWYRQDLFIEDNDNGYLLDKISREYKHLYFNCCEQWMMACKAILFNDEETFKKIMDEKSPSTQKDLGRTIKNYDNDIWDYYKYRIVYTGNEYKFDQNPELKDFLCTFNPFTTFAEASSWDKVWGIGLGPDDPKALDINTWEGENLLGKAITRLRQSYDDERN
jgi:ribA/ribD-fused uncharacterized protein